MNKISAAIATVLLGTISTNTLAESQWYMDFALAHGGDDLAEVEVEYFDGDTGDVDITAGGGFSIAAGRSFDFGNHWGLLASFGYKSDGVLAGDGDSASFDRLPVDVLGFYRLEKFKFGAGITYELNPELDLDDVDVGSFEFDNAVGFVTQVDWMVSETVAVGLRYTTIEYEVSGFSGNFDGNNISLRLGLTF